MMFFPKLLSPDKKIHEQLHSPEISKLGMYCMNIGNQAEIYGSYQVTCIPNAKQEIARNH